MNKLANRKGTVAPTRQKGSVLVICMVLAGLGTLGVAAWLSLLDARGHLAEQEFAATERRVRYQNAKAYAKNLIYANYLDSATGEDTTQTYDLPDGWGSVTIEAFATAPLIDNANVRYNKSGSTPFRAFTTDVNVGLNDGEFNHPWEFQLKSYNPVLGGDLLSIQLATETMSEDPIASGNLNVEGRAVFWNTEYQDSPSNLRADNYLIGKLSEPNLGFLNTSGTTRLPSNFPFVKQTAGNGAYDGQVDVINSSSNRHNAYFQKIIENGGFALLSGPITFADGDGIETIPDGENDDSLLGGILGGLVSSLLTKIELIANSPLSSRVLSAALAPTSNLTSTDLLEVLEANYPLPDDVVTQIADAGYTAVTFDEKEIIHDKNNTFLISDGAGRTVIDLSVPTLPHVLLNDVTSLEIRGQVDAATADAYEDLSPRVIAISNSENVHLEEVILSNFNRRQIILAIQCEGVLDNSGLTDESGNATSPSTNHTIFRMTGESPFTDWRLIGDFEGIMADFDASFVSASTIEGGIRSNHMVRVTGGTITIQPEHDFEFVESLLSRNAWIETFRK